MNVLIMFEGDNDTDLAWIQHDCYWSTLTFFPKILNETFPNINLPKIDHRTVQGFHDILAAAYRYEFHNPDAPSYVDDVAAKDPNLTKKLPFDSTAVVNDWQNWLKLTLDGEFLILEELAKVYFNQNTADGYKFEEKVQALILKKFSHIKWEDYYKEKINQMDLESNSKEIAKQNLYKKKMNFLVVNSNTKLDILNSELVHIENNIEILEDRGAVDTFHPSVCIDWLTNQFYPSRSGWSYVGKFEYQERRKQLENRLPDGSGCVYILGIVGQGNLCKIGFTTLSAHERAKDYGKTYGLSFYIFDIIPSKNAGALEKRLHEKYAETRYAFKGSKEIFIVSPEVASKQARSLEPSSESETINRELQWLYLELESKQSQIAKETWACVDTLHRRMKLHNLDEFDFSLEFQEIADKFQKDEESVYKYYEQLKSEIDQAIERKNFERIRITKFKVKQRSWKRWRRRHGFGIPARKRKPIVYSAMVLVLLVIVFLFVVLYILG